MYQAVLLALATVMVLSCEKDSGSDDSPENIDDPISNYYLIIENGAVGLEPDAVENYKAYFVNALGEMILADDVHWEASNTDVGTIGANGAFTVTAVGVTTLTATATKDGKTYSVSVPVSVNAPSVFTAAPMAYIGLSGDTFQIEGVYLSTDMSELSYTYSTSDVAVASVSSSGLVTVVGSGSCTITVEGKKDGNVMGTYSIPVMTMAEPEISLPVTRVTVSPAATDLFRGETKTFTAQAYSFGDAVEADMAWSIADASIATVDQTGKITPVKPGRTTLRVTAENISAQAEVIINKDTIIGINPMIFSVAPGKTKQLQAEVYKINRTSAEKVGTAADVTWEIPQYGMSMFDVASIDQNGLVTAKSNATAGMTGIVVAYLKGDTEPSGGSSFSIAMASDCDCGSGDASVESIEIVQGSSITVSQMDMSTTTLSAVAKDASGASVSGATIKYCSDNMQVAIVEDNGEIVPVMAGTAIITACNGNVTSEITVTVEGMDIMPGGGGFGF